MRSNFTIQPELGIVPIEKIQIPARSRDKLAPILLALQHIHSTPEILDQIFTILEAKIRPGTSKDKGRLGLTHWQILVLGIVRHARNCDYDQLEDLAAHHNLSHKTISKNVCHITEEVLQDINKIIALHGHNILSKKQRSQ